MSEEAKPYKVAVLDERGVFLRTLELAAGIPPGPRQVDLRPYGGDCDLPGGKYRWDTDACQFVPLPPERQKLAEEAPTLEEAWYAFLKEGAAAPTVAAWMEWYERSLDGQIGEVRGGG